MSALSTNYKHNIDYSADFDSTDADGFVVNFDVYQAEAVIALPLQFIDDYIPEKQEALLIRVYRNDDK